MPYFSISKGCFLPNSQCEITLPVEKGIRVEIEKQQCQASESELQCGNYALKKNKNQISYHTSSQEGVMGIFRGPKRPLILTGMLPEAGNHTYTVSTKFAVAGALASILGIDGKQVFNRVKDGTLSSMEIGELERLCAKDSLFKGKLESLLSLVAAGGTTIDGYSEWLEQLVMAAKYAQDLKSGFIVSKSKLNGAGSGGYVSYVALVNVDVATMKSRLQSRAQFVRMTRTFVTSKIKGGRLVARFYDLKEREVSIAGVCTPSVVVDQPGYYGEKMETQNPGDAYQAREIDEELHLQSLQNKIFVLDLGGGKTLFGYRNIWNISRYVPESFLYATRDGFLSFVVDLEKWAPQVKNAAVGRPVKEVKE